MKTCVPIRLGLWLALSALVAPFATQAQTRPQCVTTEWVQAYDRMTICTSSFLKSSQGTDYTVASLVDGRGSTTWCEGRPGVGLGESITLNLEGAAPLQGVWIKNGDARSADHYARNGRVRTFRVEIRTFADEVALSFRADIPDRAAEHYVAMPGLVDNPALVRFTIKDVYPGSAFNDTCMHGFAPDFGF